MTREVFLTPPNSFLATSVASNSETTLDYCCILRCMLLYAHSLDASVPSDWLPYMDAARTYRKHVSRVRMHGTNHRKHWFLYCCEGMLTAPLPSNRSPTLAYMYVAGLCLATRSLAVGLHVTVYYVMSDLMACIRHLVFLGYIYLTILTPCRVLMFACLFRR
jgi:hypothetical protein